MGYSLTYTGTRVQELLDSIGALGTGKISYSLYPATQEFNTSVDDITTVQYSSIILPSADMEVKIGDLLLSSVNNIWGKITALSDQTCSVQTLGVIGATFTPHVDDGGTLTWTNDSGLPNPSPANIQGPTGAKITKTELVSELSSGNKYQQTFDNGVTAEFIAPKGPQGATGTVFIPSVSSDGVISWTNDGGLANPSEVNIRGPRGFTGATGPQGEIGPIGYVFTPSVSKDGVISWTNNGGLENPSAAYIKGPAGAKIVSTELWFMGDDSYDYKQTFDDGTIQYFKAPRGPIGYSGLMCNTTVLSYSQPGVDYLPVSSFNRTPNVDETFLLLWNQRNSSSDAIVDTYMCIAKVTQIKDSRVDFSVPYSYSIMGATGATGAKGDTGAGITSASAQAVIITEEYTTTPIAFSLSDGSVIGPVNVRAKNGITPNCIAYVGTVEASAWISSSTYTSYGYGYQAKIPKYDQSDLVYAFETYVPEVIPADVVDIMGTNFAPFAETRTDGLIIYAKEKPTTAKTFNITLTHTNSKS